MNNKKIWYAPNKFEAYGDNEINAVINCLKDGHLAGFGPKTIEFEQKVSKYFGKKYGLFVNSGSAANLLAISCLKTFLSLESDCEVITPACTFSTTVAPIIQCGLKPVFCDVGFNNYVVNIDDVVKLITDNTRIIILPNLIGNKPDWKRLREYVDTLNHRIYLIEDSCDTMTYTKETDISTSSFYASHIITSCGSGGMYMCNDKELLRIATMYRDWGRIGENSEEMSDRFNYSINGIPYDYKFLYEVVGYNFKSSEINASFGLVQLNKLDKIKETRRQLFTRYLEKLKNNSMFILPDDNLKSDWLSFPLLCINNNRKEVLTYLEDNNVQTRVCFAGNITYHPAYLQYKQSFVNADNVMKNGFLVGCHHGMTVKDVDYVCKLLLDFKEGYAKPLTKTQKKKEKKKQKLAKHESITEDAAPPIKEVIQISDTEVKTTVIKISDTEIKETDDDDLVCAVLMVKNEEADIKLTIDAFKNHIKHVAVFDTGSTDRTVEIVKKTCETNNQILYLKEGVFKNFPESRNEFFDFIEKNVKCKFLILIDAADEFQSDKSKKEFLNDLKNIPNSINFCIIRQKWIEHGRNSEHSDVRLVRNKVGCRYDVDIPVHVTFLNMKNPFEVNSFILFQDRMKHGDSTKIRLQKDVEAFLSAKKTKRNLYYLAQTYMNLDDFKNGFKYAIESLELPEDPFKRSYVDERHTCTRAAYCAIMDNMPFKTILKYCKKVIDGINGLEPIIEAYVYIFRSSINYNCPFEAVPYIEQFFNLKEPNDQRMYIKEFYTYQRYHLISIVCLLTGQNLDIGYKSCKLAVKAFPNPEKDDVHNLNLYQQVLGK